MGAWNPKGKSIGDQGSHFSGSRVGTQGLEAVALLFLLLLFLLVLPNVEFTSALNHNSKFSGEGLWLCLVRSNQLWLR